MSLIEKRYYQETECPKILAEVVEDLLIFTEPEVFISLTITS